MIYIIVCAVVLIVDIAFWYQVRFISRSFLGAKENIDIPWFKGVKDFARISIVLFATCLAYALGQGHIERSTVLIILVLLAAVIYFVATIYIFYERFNKEDNP